MPASESKSPRQFRVQKDNGEFWNMNFTKAGVNWSPSDTPFETSAHNQPFTMPVGGPMAYAQTIASVVDTATNVGMWWETRQRRLLDEAINEESRRISWLGDMMARWGEIHQPGNLLDLRVSEYLARETREMMDSIVVNKRVALPQSMLYELENVQDTFRSFRSLILFQFEMLSEDLKVDLDAVIQSSLPNCRLDMGFIRSLGTDPSVDWADRVQTKTTGEFDRRLTESLSDPSAFLSRVFPRAEQEKQENEASERSPGFGERLVGLIAPALPRLLTIDYKSDASERRDSFRELSLLPAEVARVKALNSAWLATSAIVAASTGNEVLVQVGAGGMGIELAPIQAPRALMA